MTRRFNPVYWEADNYLEMEESLDGEYVHFSDYEKLVDALRLVRRHAGSDYNSEIAEAALLSAGEKI